VVMAKARSIYWGRGEGREKERVAIFGRHMKSWGLDKGQLLRREINF